jgi:hypothetical protein
MICPQGQRLVEVIGTHRKVAAVDIHVACNTNEIAAINRDARARFKEGHG